MARETQKEKIERLEKEIEVFKSNQIELNRIIDNMVDKANDSFENSSDFISMSKQIDDLKIKLKTAQQSADHNRKMYENEIKVNEKLDKEIRKLKDEYGNIKSIDTVKCLKNERGAGRKPRFTDSDIETMKRYRLDKITIKEIARIFNCSVGLVHKLTNEN